MLAVLDLNAGITIRKQQQTFIHSKAFAEAFVCIEREGSSYDKMSRFDFVMQYGTCWLHNRNAVRACITK